ncbi:mas-related G-protein coupled receptor member H-like [Molothrus ater]|uniref:mas-related G-protein coupled receptor member H-like n=1 Tax=Molothrus ater TaxID=84834 RepID=UPI0017494D73|nr:mas-related G-protein coupled receptor member H-like [Molothrus ater]
MEVTNVSPSPASPTEGDHLCETDATTMAIHSVTLLICLCGLAGNGAVIGLLSLKICNSGVFDLAVIDFFFLLFAVPSALLFLVEDVSCSPILPELYLSFLFQLSVVSLYWGLFWLMSSRNVGYVYKLCKLCFRWELPQRLMWVVGTVQYWAFFALFTVIPTVTLLCPSHQQEHCRAALISMNTIILLLLAAPVAISSTVDFIKAKWGSQQQQLKRRDIVIFIIVLFMFLLTIWNFLQQLGYMAVSSQVVFLLICIHSSIKPFIYFLVGRCRRPFSIKSLQLSLQRVFEEPEENTAHSDDPAMDMGSEPADPFHCSDEGSQESGWWADLEPLD